VERAAALAIYTQGIAREILSRPTLEETEDVYLVYGFNRFQACRFGLQGEIVDPVTRTRRVLADDVRETLAAVRRHGRPDDEGAWQEIGRCLESGNDAAWLRERFAATESLGRVVGMQMERFAGTL
jgi:carboxylate-amine ligase